jgi:DNA-binding transcriptional MerR regulator
MAKALEAFRTISEVAEELDVQKHVLRFWENKFPQVRPMKRGGGRRYYRPDDLDLLRGIRFLLHREGYTIKGVQKLLREQGLEFVKACWQVQPARTAAKSEAAAPKEALQDASGVCRRHAGRGRRPPVRRQGDRAAASAPAAYNRNEHVAAPLVGELEDCRRILQGAEVGASPGDARQQVTANSHSGLSSLPPRRLGVGDRARSAGIDLAAAEQAPRVFRR